jgi:hypothetical protein
MITAPWEAGVGIRHAVAMRPTTLRTYTLSAVGVANAAIRVAGAAPHAQRILVKHDTDGQLVFLTSAANELNGPGGAAPAGTYALPADDIIDFVIAPGQELLAAASVAGVRLSVSTSQIIPIPQSAPERMRIATFQQKALALAGVPNATRQIVTSSNHPQRVLVHNPSNSIVYVASSGTGTLDYAAPAGPIAFAFELRQNQTAKFITAPGQSLDAVSDGSPVISVQVSEIPLDAPRGPTGTPGDE